MRVSGRISIALTTAALTLLVANPVVRAQGQARRGGFQAEGVRLRLLALPKVQEDLKLTDDQKAEARKAGEGLQGLFAGLQNVPQEERRQKMQEVQAKVTAAVEQVNKVLSKEQNERLDQIALQARGAGALADEKVAAQLKLSDEQKRKLTEIQQQAFQQARALQQGEQEKRAEIMKTAREEALAVLTEEQKKEFQEMQGDKIDLPENFGFGGGRRQQQ